MEISLSTNRPGNRHPRPGVDHASQRPGGPLSRGLGFVEKTGGVVPSHPIWMAPDLSVTGAGISLSTMEPVIAAAAAVPTSTEGRVDVVWAATGAATLLRLGLVGLRRKRSQIPST